MKPVKSIKDIEDNFKKDFPFFDNFERKAITEFYSQQITELSINYRERIIKDVIKFIDSLPYYGNPFYLTGGPYTDEPMRGPNVESVVLVNRKTIKNYLEEEILNNLK